MPSRRHTVLRLIPSWRTARTFLDLLQATGNAGAAPSLMRSSIGTGDESARLAPVMPAA